MRAVSPLIIPFLEEVDNFGGQFAKNLLTNFFYFTSASSAEIRKVEDRKKLTEFYARLRKLQRSELSDFLRILAAEHDDLISPETIEFLARIKDVLNARLDLKGTDQMLLVGCYACRKYRTREFGSQLANHIVNALELKISNPNGTLKQMAEAKQLPSLQETKETKAYVITPFGEEILEGLLGPLTSL